MTLETQPVELFHHRRPSVQAASNLMLVVMALMFTLGGLAQSLYFEAGMAFTQWALILLPALWFWKRCRLPWAVFARVKPLPLKFIPAIVLLVFSTWFLLVFVEGALISYLTGLGFEPLEKIAPPDTVNQLLIYYLTIAVSAGICEEVLFRGTLMPSMERQGVLPALLFSSLLFAMAHMSFLNLFSTFTLGMVIGLLVIKTGSLLAGVLYHTLNNAIAVTFMYYDNIYGLEETLEQYRVTEGSAALLIIILSTLGAIAGWLLLNRQSAVTPLTAFRNGWLPRGWLNWAVAIIVLLFLFTAVLELLIGFGRFSLGQPS